MKKITCSLLLAGLVVYCAKAQDPADGPEIVNTAIPGAPKLKKPVLIMGGDKPVMAKGNGIAAPAFLDMDDDGRKDLLIGEFMTGVEHGEPMTGNFLRVYNNSGDNRKPLFTAAYSFAHPSYEMVNNGTPMSVMQGCCMGFTPELVDFDNDGKTDILTGQYLGFASWFRGMGNGNFEDGRIIEQDGNPFDLDYKVRHLQDLKSQHYWAYSIASFGDLDDDGLVDMVTGGYTLRFSKHTMENGKHHLGKRELLLGVDGKPLKMNPGKPNPKEAEEMEKAEKLLSPGYFYMVAPTVVDWDSDGVPDLLVTNAYYRTDLPLIVFYKGVKTSQGIRFQPGVSLVEGKNGAKLLPGRWPHISVTDFNDDGVKDLLIGVSVMTLHDYEFSPLLSWNYEQETGIPKYDPGLLKTNGEPTIQSWIDEYFKAPAVKPRVSAEDFRTAKHCGYVYILLGEKK